ncbi:alpha/beta fold hydrolase [Vagococcus sp. JNUCC 83]
MYIDINRTTLYYEEYGKGIPVICLHGFSVDSNLMKGCLEPIFKDKKNFHRIYVDLVGMGNSPENKNIKNTDDMLNVVVQFIHTLVGEHDFLLFGESYGGYLSLGLLQHFSEQIKGLFLICPLTVANNEERKLPQKELIKIKEFTVDSDDKVAYQNFLDMSVTINENTWIAYKKDILPGIEKANSEYLSFLSHNEYSLSCESLFHTIKFNKPTVMLLGKQDHVVGYQDALNLLPNFSRGTFAVIDGAGHNLQIEKPKLFSSFVENFLCNV